jgi:hypothetical protein
MAVGEFEEIATEVLEALQEDGAPLRVTAAPSAGAGTYDPTNDVYVGGPSAAAYTDTLALNDVAGTGAARGIATTAGDETEITTGFWIAAVDANGAALSVRPGPGTLLTWGGNVYRCRWAREYAPGGLPILYYALAER